MLKTIVLAMSIAFLSGTAPSFRPQLVKMLELTVPAERLPAGCVLSTNDTARRDGTRVRSRNWAGLGIPSNPWAGTDRPLVASIRQRMEPTVTPDGPPPSRSDAASFRLHFADGVEEAYAAIYEQSETELIVVYASRFASSDKAVESRSYSGWSNNPRVIRVAMGLTVAMVHGESGPCFNAVGAHLRSLAK
jgi:hypothetical protein